jgi:RNA polymerase sigma-70 factor, ECF subfamily
LPGVQTWGYLYRVPALPRSRASHAGLEVLDGGQAPRVRGLTDEQVVEAVARADGSVADELYDRLIDTVERTLYRMLGKRVTEHDDLVQAAFEQIVGTLRRRTYAGECSLKGWASVVTSRIALNAIRARKRQRHFIDAGQSADDVSRGLTSSADVYGEVAARRDLERLRRILGDMGDSKALPIVLHEILGHDLAEIATLTGTSIAATQSQLVRGRRELRRRMEAEEAAKPTKRADP